MYILDTDLLSLLGRADSPAAQRLHARLSPLKAEERITTIITYEEQMRGWMAHLAKARSLAKQVEAYAQLSEFQLRYRRLTVLRFDDRAAAEFERLQKQRIRIGTMDLKIAAIALRRRATLLTRNAKDFSRVPQLKIEDWSV